MVVTKEFFEIMAKVIDAIQKNPEKLTNTNFLGPLYSFRHDETAFTVENLENVASNHLFDDNPSLFGITLHEGYTIRHCFIVGADTYAFVNELRQKFPDFFKIPESPEYSDWVNSRRKSHGLKPIYFKR